MAKIDIKPDKLVNLCELALADAKLLMAQDKTRYCLNMVKKEAKVWWRKERDFDYFYENYDELTSDGFGPNYATYSSWRVENLLEIAQRAKITESSMVVLDEYEVDRLFHAFTVKKERANGQEL